MSLNSLNINLKIEVQSQGIKLRKYKKLPLELEKELQTVEKDVGGSRGGEHELKEALADRECELRELRCRRAVGPDNGVLTEAEAHNAELEEWQATLEEQLENMKSVMEDNMDDIDRLAATTIELQQREEKLEICCQEIDEMIFEHRRQLEAVDEEWNGEVKLRRPRLMPMTFATYV